jgi:endonuclease G
MDRAGYDADYLGIPVPMPAPRSGATVRLDYVHFSVLLDPDRRLAASSAVNLDGTDREGEKRADSWHVDERVDAAQQVGQDFYRGSGFDRGHQVRRVDPSWGDPATSRAAEHDTFAFPNIAPQVGRRFNQSKREWLGIEDFVRDHAIRFQARFCVFTGPVLNDDDPRFRGVGIPLRFWKIAAWANGDELSAAGYVLSQEEFLSGVQFDAIARPDATFIPSPGHFRTFHYRIASIADFTGLDLDQLIEADRWVPKAGALIYGRAAPEEVRSRDDLAWW